MITLVDFIEDQSTTNGNGACRIFLLPFSSSFFFSFLRATFSIYTKACGVLENAAPKQLKQEFLFLSIKLNERKGKASFSRT
jgi:hypothetical protein